MSLRKTVVVAVVALSAAAFVGSSAHAAKRVKWKMHTAWAQSVPHIGAEAKRFSDDVIAMTGGGFNLKHFDPGALIPANEGFDAVSKGSIESVWSTAGYDVGKYPALAFYTAVPYGPSIGEMMAWIWYGGGYEIEERIYGKHNIIPMHCLAIGPETSGWFRYPLPQNLLKTLGFQTSILTFCCCCCFCVLGVNMLYVAVFNYGARLVL